VFLTALALALVGVALVLVLRPSDMPYLDFLRQGDEHAARAERTAAVAAYREAAELRPADPEPYVRMAQVYLDWGRAEDALAAVAQAERRGGGAGGGSAGRTVDLERTWVAVQVARADWLAVVEHAQRLLAAAAAGGEDASAARHALARAYVELGEWDAARAEYEALLKVDAGDSVAHERLGALLVGSDPVAIQHLFAAGTELAERLLAALGEVGVAEDPAYGSALLGQVLFEAQEWALAARQFERALALSPDYPDAHAYLGHALARMGRPGEARPHLLEAVALEPDSVVARTFLGLYYDQVGDVAAARAEYEAVYDLDPTNPATCVEIGQTWVAEDRYLAADIWLREAVALEPEDPALWEVLARFYLDHHITAQERGVEAAVRLVELSPDDARAHDLRGWAAFQVGDYETARESLLHATSLDPRLASAYYHLGRLRAAEGRHEEARDVLARAVDLDTTGELVPLVEQALGEMSDQ
jgi:Flp pilus assembly protein TadD